MSGKRETVGNEPAQIEKNDPLEMKIIIVEIKAQSMGKQLKRGNNKLEPCLNKLLKAPGADRAGVPVTGGRGVAAQAGGGTRRLPTRAVPHP